MHEFDNEPYVPTAADWEELGEVFALIDAANEYEMREEAHA